MNSKIKSKDVTFRTLEEYRQYYSIQSKGRISKGSNYYRIGESIAKMACDDAVKSLQNEAAIIDR